MRELSHLETEVRLLNSDQCDEALVRAAVKSGAAPFLVEMYIRVGYRVLSTDPRIAYLGKAPFWLTITTRQYQRKV